MASRRRAATSLPAGSPVRPGPGWCPSPTWPRPPRRRSWTNPGTSAASAVPRPSRCSCLRPMGLGPSSSDPARAATATTHCQVMWRPLVPVPGLSLRQNAPDLGAGAPQVSLAARRARRHLQLVTSQLTNLLVTFPPVPLSCPAITHPPSLLPLILGLSTCPGLCALWPGAPSAPLTAPLACGCPRSLLFREAPEAGSEPGPWKVVVAIWLGWREGLGQAAAGGGLHLCALTVRAQASVRHYRICTAANGLYLQKGRLFPSLEELLAYYKANWKLIHNPLLQPCVPQDGWERPRSEFALQRKLGEGYFGEVWEGLWLDSTPVAVKVIKSAYVKLADLTKEIQTLKSLRHERLIRLHAVCSAGEPVYIVTELMRKGNLQAFLGSPEGRALGLSLLLGFACHVAEGMSYLEERRIVHRDLAARNVLVGDDLGCKVADFGLARLLKEDIYSPSSGSKIPVKWTAPEAANYRVYSQKSDVWSFGVLLYEVFTYGQCPYEGLSNHETLQQVTWGYRLPRPASCPAEVYALMLECWRSSPEERPAFAALQETLDAARRRLHPALT
ncbi:tyrosine-protein kinase Srms isoform X2 [Acinonyx jubatus]|uniref:non-specific protein-tyrosine kinase n=1 Tax=Acinonyx jubatus TaxID=32536 RepID=A0ABM3N8C3_ACIJB|nr:tyrosine-protein kinase Srms isoform X2 [Acinonyx jubatus]